MTCDVRRKNGYIFAGTKFHLASSFYDQKIDYLIY